MLNMLVITEAVYCEQVLTSDVSSLPLNFLSPHIQLSASDFQKKWPEVIDQDRFVPPAVNFTSDISYQGRSIGTLFNDPHSLLGTNSSIQVIKLDSLEVNVIARKSGITLQPDTGQTKALNVYYCIGGQVGLDILSNDGKLLGQIELLDGDVYYGLKGYKYRKNFSKDAVLVEVREEGAAEEKPENMTLTRARLEKRIYKEMKLNMPEVIEDKDRDLIAGFRVSRATDVKEGRYQVYAPKEMMLDVGINRRDSETTAPLHIHTPRKDKTMPRAEIIIVDQGGLRLGMYGVPMSGESGELVKEARLTPGMFAVLTEGHDVTFLGSDTRVIEMKQGPYPADVAGDKRFLNKMEVAPKQGNTGARLAKLFSKANNKEVLFKNLMKNGELVDLIPEFRHMENSRGGSSPHYEGMSAFRHTEKMIEMLQAIADDDYDRFNGTGFEPLQRAKFSKLVEEYKEIAKDDERLFTLWLSIILHDIGKIKNLPLHTLYGAVMAQGILDRMQGLNERVKNRAFNLIAKHVAIGSARIGEVSTKELKNVDLRSLRVLTALDIRCLGEAGELTNRKFDFTYNFAPVALAKNWGYKRIKRFLSDWLGNLDEKANIELEAAYKAMNDIGSELGAEELAKTEDFLDNSTIYAYMLFNKLDGRTLIKFLYLMSKISEKIPGLQIDGNIVNNQVYTVTDFSDENAIKLANMLKNKSFSDIKKVVEAEAQLPLKLARGEKITFYSLPLYINKEFYGMVIDTKGLQSSGLSDSNSKANTPLVGRNEQPDLQEFVDAAI